MNAYEHRIRVMQDKSLKDIARIAFFDPRKLSHEDGRIKMPQELDEDTAAAIESFEIRSDGSFKYKFRDKLSALDKIAKLLGLY
jgi:phage terminase small subunit